MEVSDGNRAAIDQLLPAVYDELRRLAQSYMRKESSGHTLTSTSLVHEAYMRLIDQKVARWQNRAHFFGVAAQLMRRLLVDHARGRQAAKRGGNETHFSFDDALHWESDEGPDLVALDLALQKLSQLDERQGRVVELRYFGGLSVEETAEVMGTSPATVKRDWTVAKAWLYRELTDNSRDN
jgi:RNA polymerase sigma factor (TIGR02999 family)